MSAVNEKKLSATQPTSNTFVIRRSHEVTEKDREAVLDATEYNAFSFPATMLIVDYLSDSGSTAMTDTQWAGIVRGDEAVGGHNGFFAVAHAVRDTFDTLPADPAKRTSEGSRMIAACTGDDRSEKWWIRHAEDIPAADPHTFAVLGKERQTAPNMFIVCQGRCTESLLYTSVGRAFEKGGVPKPWVIPSNGFFDTTEAQAATHGFTPKNLFAPNFFDAFDVDKVDSENPFKGNIDLDRYKEMVEKEHEHMPFVLMTVTNNTAAGQPVSMANLRAVAEIAHKYNVPVLFDAARFAENAWFIQKFEKPYCENGASLRDVVSEMFSYCDVFTMSSKKDGLCNMGGMFCFRHDGLFEQRFSKLLGKNIGLLLQEIQTLRYGDPTHGGVSGRDAFALAIGLRQVLLSEYMDSRCLQVRRLAVDMIKAGVKGVVMPPGGHAVYLDMTEFFKGTDMKIDDFGGVGFVIEMIRLYGIRPCELGPFAFEWDQKNDEQREGILNLVRFAVPRNTYNDEHIAYTVAATAELQKHADKIPKVRVARGAELHLRHFQSGLKAIYENGKLGEK